MPDDLSGNYSPPPESLAVDGNTAYALQHNSLRSDVGTALTGRLTRNGTGAMQANLPMGNFRITGLAAALADTDAATLGQARSNGVPIGFSGDYWGGTVPDGWLLCAGQAVSRATYPDLFTVIGTMYGPGDGVTTFNLPDTQDRVVAGKGNMSGTPANRITTFDSDVLGATGGSGTHTLITAETPVITPAGTVAITDPGHTHDVNSGNNYVRTGGGAINLDSGGSFSLGSAPLIAASNTTGITAAFSGTPHGSGGAHNNVQPTIMANKIIKALNV